ncbi:MAG: CRISPR system precrRNA processing endoribonuclease RAMP protein Cas6 [Rhodospirillales bacterium]|nr:CRISPR system precrRNA processing endoribonuclease RAMP protein Cas6 [Rhodospirillales bacterium]
MTLDFDALAMHWRRTFLVFVCARPEALEEGPWLAAALRGAWGRQLLAMAAHEHQGARHRRRADPFGRASALEVFFREHAHLTPRLAVPKPFVIAIESDAGAVRITLTLFGVAGFWRRDARDAMMAALAAGLPLRGDGRLRRRYDLTDVYWGRSESVSVPEPARQVLLRLRTPLCLRASGAIENNLDDLGMSLVNRLSGLARWQGVRIDTDWGGWRERSKRVRATLDHAGFHAGRRHSSAQPGREIPHVGLTGTIRLEGPLGPFMPLLALGETAHAGARAAFGFGAYELLVY